METSFKNNFVTRINVGVDPSELPSKLLIAEHREITRIPNAVLNRNIKLIIPPVFKLGTGHVRFFYDKLKFLHFRYNNLYQECLVRDFDVTNKVQSFEQVKMLHPELYNDYDVKPADRQLIIDRIESRGFTLL